MGLSEFLRKLFDSKNKEPITRGIAPIFAEVALTNACDLECTHCSRVSFSKDGKELDQRVMTRFIEQFRQQAGQIICFSGGEPLIKKKLLFHLLEHCQTSGISSSIISNGQFLDKSMAQSLQERGIGAIGISIDGDKTFHDKFRAKQGCYDLAVQAVKNAVALDISTYIMTVPTNEGIQTGSFEHVVALAENLGAIPYINFPTQCGEWKGDASHLLSRDKLEKLYKMIESGRIRKDVGNKEVGRKCPALSGQIYISAWGDVCPCPFIQISFGNIFEQSLEKIMTTIETSGYLDKEYHCCPPAEDHDFIRDIVSPIYKGNRIPLHIDKHPGFKK